MEGESSQKPIHRSRPFDLISLYHRGSLAFVPGWMLFSHKRLTCWCCLVVISQCSTGSSNLWKNTATAEAFSAHRRWKERCKYVDNPWGGCLISLPHSSMKQPQGSHHISPTASHATEYHFSPPIQLPKAVFWFIIKLPWILVFFFLNVCK